MARFGELLRRHRVAAGFTQEALVEKAGLSARGLSDLERGLRRWPHADTVRRIAEALKLEGVERARLEATAAAPLSATVPSGSQRGGPSAQLPARATSSDSWSCGDNFGHAAQLTSFIGRSAELGQVQQLLGRTRLLTLIGSGEIGKTRLALQVAQSEQIRNGQQVEFVDLVPVADADLAPQSVGVSLGVREQPGTPVLTMLIRAIRNAPLLLLLDNCEHHARAWRELIDALLRGCPRMRILATSRSVLGVPGETVWSVPPLSVPGISSSGLLEEVRHSEAVSLFLERAQRLVQILFLTTEPRRESPLFAERWMGTHWRSSSPRLTCVFSRWTR
ncbi:MAG: helix-turn-helix domain-containing protein [Chloroflexi bacterium]|nr:helix-turn-helix domain-containing protein [Chloroflexota bacterium]